MKNVILFLLILSGLVFFSACNSSRSIRSEAVASAPLYGDDISGMKEMEEGNTQDPIERKVIFSAYLSVTVKYPDTANLRMASVAEKYEGYINRIGTDQTVIRVKSEYLEAAIESISQLGKIRHKRLDGQDVTNEYYDFKIRVENAEKARSRYLELLAKAEDVKAALLVEKELERLNGEIDFYQGRINRMDHLSEFSTITVEWHKKPKLGILGYIGKGLYEGVKWLFVRG